MKHRDNTRSKKGVAAIYAAVTIGTLMLFASLAVDLGRVQIVKVELQNAADAAIRAAATGLATSAEQARANAIAVAGQNIADGTAVVLTNSDIDVGNWTNGVFTNNGTPNNAIRVRVSRTAAAGNAIPLLMARVFGRNGCDCHVSAIATVASGQPSAFYGFNKITVKNNAFFGSYNSSDDTSPSHGDHLNNGMVGSNGTIDGNNNNDIYGRVTLGPSASIDDFTVHGTTTTQTTAFTKPTLPTWSPGTNPGGVAQNYTVSSNKTLAAGTYWFTSLTINANLSFSGPTTVYVNGDIDLNGDIKATSLIPGHLTIYQYGSHTFGDSGSNAIDIYATVIAPDCDFTSKNNLNFYGSGMFNNITCKNSADFYCDEASSSGSGGTTVSLVD